MAVQGERLLKSYNVAGATGTSFVIGYISAADTIARASGSGSLLVGVIENNPTNSSDKASVVVSGMAKVHAGTAAIARGAGLTADARGYAIATTNSGDNIIGYAEEASTVNGQLIQIKVAPAKL